MAFKRAAEAVREQHRSVTGGDIVFESQGCVFWKHSEPLYCALGTPLIPFYCVFESLFSKFRGHTPLYSISVSNMFFKKTSLPPTPSWDRFDLHVTVLFVLLMD